ncbi:uncharacterized protein G2W53_012058 [Senna tora]|uniref:Uncharacterized protein n=1 Tax=Senna tora TaxID=362788 RepID=A0A834TW74_9FABA|nr:uncharacterized protein G2W53_012058 [Senna tora]
MSEGVLIWIWEVGDGDSVTDVVVDGRDGHEIPDCVFSLSLPPHLYTTTLILIHPPFHRLVTALLSLSCKSQEGRGP